VKFLCLDLEGVLIPEVWQGVAALTGIDALNKTTRDIPVYEELMNHRLRILAEHDIRMSAIEGVVTGLAPLPGAGEFLNWARERFQVAIISDTFYQFAQPLMRQLGFPTLLCHTLVVEDDRIAGYSIRQSDPKRASVRALKSLRYTVLAAGDSYNDIPMLEEADAGFFYQAPDQVRDDYPQYQAAESYEELKRLLESVE